MYHCLQDELKGDKQDLFRVWLKNSGSWGQVTAHYKRKRIQSQSGKQLFGFQLDKTIP